MKFRTEIDHSELKGKIDYSTNILALGSCFAQSIAERLSAAKFRVELCPTGILFNPASIADTLVSFANQAPAERSRFVSRGESWVSLDSHSDLMRTTLEEAISALEDATARGHQVLYNAQCVIITFGTAWVYRHNSSGKIVANCHKVPQSEFTRYRLSVEEIVALYKPLLEGILSDKQVIFTLSPVRHIADGLAENSLSKATLRVAIAELCTLYPNAEYFPAYEIVTDDLRDYRFYADDLVHPSQQAVQYIWEVFSKAALSTRAQALLPRVKQIVDAAVHRPANPTSEAYRNFCSRYLKEAKAITEVDFSDECAIFERYSVKS